MFLTYTSSYLNWSKLTILVSPIGYITPFILGPLIFQYIKTVYNSKIDFKKFTLSLIPFGIAIIIYTIPQYVFGISLDDKKLIFQIISIAIPFLGILHLAYYLFLCNKLLKRFRILVKNNYANISSLDLKWLSIWIWGFIFFLIIDTISGLLLIRYSIPDAIIHINICYLVLLIWYICYYGVNQVQVFLFKENPINFITADTSQDNLVKTSYEYNCKSIEFIELKAKLDHLFTAEELFKKQNLSLRKTADILSTSDKKLSYLLNVCLESNFYEYVNNHRVTYFRKKLENGDAEKLTLLALAFDSGFNSKATFNRVIKQKTGMTPKDLKKLTEKRSQSFQ